MQPHLAARPVPILVMYDSLPPVLAVTDRHLGQPLCVRLQINRELLIILGWRAGPLLKQKNTKK